MATVTLQGIKSGAFDYAEPTTNFHSSQTVQYGAGQYLCVKFGELPAALQYKEITSVTLKVYVTGARHSLGTSGKRLKMSSLTREIDPETVTYTDNSVTYPSYGPYVSEISIPGYASRTELADQEGTLVNMYLRYGAIADADIYFVLATTRYTQKPQLIVEYDETDVPLVIQDQTKFSSGSDRETWGAGKANVIRWYAPPSTKATYLPVKQTTAKVQWKLKDGNVINEIDIDAGATDETNYCQITVPAGVLPAGEIMWHVYATGTNGKLTVSDWFEHKV